MTHFFDTELMNFEEGSPNFADGETAPESTFSTASNTENDEGVVATAQEASGHKGSEATVSGFYDDDEKHTFGTVKKDRNRPLSNFTFKFIKKVVSHHSSSTGYLVEVTPEAVGGDSDSDTEESATSSSRLCFFTSDSTMKKDKFMLQINHSLVV